MTPGQTTLRLAAAMLIIVTTCLLCCTLQPPPEPREPDVTVVYELPDGGGPATCETVAANIETLGGCGLDMPRFRANCEDAQAPTAELGRRLPLECMSVAADCKAALACRVEVQ